MRWAKTSNGNTYPEIGAASKADLAGPESGSVLDFRDRSKEQRHFPKTCANCYGWYPLRSVRYEAILTLGRESLPYKRMGELRSEIETAMVRAASGAVEVDPDVAERLVRYGEKR